MDASELKTYRVLRTIKITEVAIVAAPDKDTASDWAHMANDWNETRRKFETETVDEL